MDRAPRTRCDDRRLSRRSRAGDGRARHVLIERYLPLARSLAFRYSRSADHADDLVQVASFGLVKAADRWDPDRGLAFSTFAVPTILGELRRYFRDATWLVRPPRALMELALAVERAREPLCTKLGREPTVAELAVRLARSPEEIAAAVVAAESRWATPLETPTGEEGSELMGSEDDGYARAEARVTFERLLTVLDRRAREVVRLRFRDDLLQSEIADRVGISQLRVSRILRRSLATLGLQAVQA
jgi:RNA polymerase sigma-B factor